MKTFCFKLYNSERNFKLHKQINAAGLIYNHCIAFHKRYYKIYHKSLNVNKLKKHLTKLKKIAKFSFLLKIGSQAVQDVAERIDRAYQLFFRNLKRKIRCSPPNFKKIRRYKSFTLKQAGWKLDEETYTLIVNGQVYRYFQSRRISGRIKTVTIKRDSLGDIYIHLTTDATDFEVVERTGKSVGYDFGSGNQCRARLNVARLYKKSANQRHDFHFKLARRLCLEYDTICIEDLNVKAMQRRYGRKIGDLAFSEFVDILKYEAAKFDIEVIEVNRYFASSQICRCCGEKNPAVKDLSIRQWRCPKCGAEHDRDRNAAINILNEGLGHRPLQEIL